MTSVAADFLIRADGALVRDGVVSVGEDGSDVQLPGRVLLPGFVNAHSHVFQRLLRGRVQRATGGAAATRARQSRRDSFWTWRGQMYELAGRLDPDDLYDAARFGFYEMLLAGFTAVGEFHYLHRAPDGGLYDNPNELGLAVLRAAHDVGIRMRLLDVLYERTGAGAAPDDVQRRFVDGSTEAWTERLGVLAEDVRDFPLCAGVGAAPHSLRAVSRAGVEAAASWALANGVPLHMHVSEQRAENDAVRAEHGCTPVELLADAGALGPAFTAVHATHLTARDVELLGGARSSVCVCPTTERDLGDGVTRGRLLADAGATLALGTDSHALVDPFEEARALELDERLVTGARVVHRDLSGRSGPPLLAALTTGGGRSIGVSYPPERGSPADVVAVDLAHVSLRGWTPDHLLEHILYAASPSAVTDVFVAGRRVIADRHHAGEEAILSGFDRLAARV